MGFEKSAVTASCWCHAHIEFRLGKSKLNLKKKKDVFEHSTTTGVDLRIYPSTGASSITFRKEKSPVLLNSWPRRTPPISVDSTTVGTQIPGLWRSDDVPFLPLFRYKIPGAYRIRAKRHHLQQNNFRRENAKTRRSQKRSPVAAFVALLAKLRRRQESGSSLGNFCNRGSDGILRGGTGHGCSDSVKRP